MSGWKNTDEQANNKPKFISHIGQPAATTTKFVANTVLVTSTRLANANTQLISPKQTAHQGWVNYTVGTGGRAGRVQSEVMVALSTPSSNNNTGAAPYFSGK